MPAAARISLKLYKTVAFGTGDEPGSYFIYRASFRISRSKTEMKNSQLQTPQRDQTPVNRRPKTASDLDRNVRKVGFKLEKKLYIYVLSRNDGDNQVSKFLSCC